MLTANPRKKEFSLSNFSEREAREKAQAEAAAQEEEEARARARAAERRELAAEVIKMIESREKKASSSRRSKRQERRARKAARDLGALAKIHGFDRTTRRAMERLLSRKVQTHKTHCILDEESDAPEKEASTNTDTESGSEGVSGTSKATGWSKGVWFEENNAALTMEQNLRQWQASVKKAAKEFKDPHELLRLKNKSLQKASDARERKQAQIYFDVLFWVAMEYGIQASYARFQDTSRRLIDYGFSQSVPVSIFPSSNSFNYGKGETKS